jgi:hypothetical protein
MSSLVIKADNLSVLHAGDALFFHLLVLVIVVGNHRGQVGLRTGGDVEARVIVEDPIDSLATNNHIKSMEGITLGSADQCSRGAECRQTSDGQKQPSPRLPCEWHFAPRRSSRRGCISG